MALLTETNEQYYGGQQAFVGTATNAPETFTCTLNTALINTTPTTNTNFFVTVNNVLQPLVTVRVFLSRSVLH